MSGVVQFHGPLRVDLLTPQECKAAGSADVQLYRLALPFAVVSAEGKRTEIPEGYVTNFGSVPAMARPYVSNENPRLNPAAAKHDYDYSTERVTREEADDDFRANLLACGMRPSQAWVVWKMVRWFGASHYGKKKPETK